jgi:gamma-glutamylcyclotransferase (GGCT)/AIG2-like uncharacterized protein YtfP
MVIPYFAYGTTQNGFAHHRRLADLLGDPVGRFRTAAAHAVVVPHEAACSNPRCPYVHRMAALVAGFEPLRVEGDLFLIAAPAAAAIERLETGAGAPYVRRLVDVVALDGSGACTARAYVAREPARWRRLVEQGRAEALASYPRHLAAGELPKECCRRAPGHPPPHDVVDPLGRR